MISLEVISYIERMLGSRNITDYYCDVFTITCDPTKKDFYSDVNAGYLYLLTHNLPEGTTIASETSALNIDQNWQDKNITKVHEFSGQVTLHLPQPGAVSEVEFFRAIPRR